MPPGLGDDASPVLDYLEAKAREEAQAKTRDAAAAFDRQCGHTLPQANELLRKACRGAGPAAASGVGTELAKQIRKLEVGAVKAQAHLAQSVVEARSDDVREQLRVRCATQRAPRTPSSRGLRPGRSGSSPPGSNRAVADLQRVVEEARLLAIDGERRAEEYRLRRTPPHAVLDRQAIDALIRDAELACSQEVYSLAARALAPRRRPWVTS